MKKTVIYSLLLLITTLAIAAMPTEAEAMIYEDTLRLHILAEDDGQAAQEMKLKIRDRLLEVYGAALGDVESIDEAEAEIHGLLGEIEEACEEWCKELGRECDVTVTLGREWYDTREYEDFTLPSGYYTSLRVILGDGKGKNWWCVMYPPLCLDLSTEPAPRDDGIIDYTREEITLISGGKYNVKFKILEMLSEAFRKNS